MLYFAYGSNMNKGQLKKFEIKYSSAEPVVLKGYKLTFTRFIENWQKNGPTWVADIEKGSDTDYVEGVLFSINDKKSLQKLDEKEGKGKAYAKQEDLPPLFKRDGTTIEKYFSYTVIDKHGPGNPSKAYKITIIGGASDPDWKLSEGYINQLKKIKVYCNCCGLVGGIVGQIFVIDK